MKKYTVLLIALLFTASCGLFGRGNAPDPDLPLPVWNGESILCNEDVSFDKAAETALPEFADDERLGLCARSIRYLELNRLYGDRTEFFGIAAASTASLAATYAPLVRRAYSDETWGFMAQMSADLETGANRVAADLAAGERVNTTALIAQDQRAVQAALDQLAATDPETYAAVIAEVGSTLNPTNRLLLAAINRNPFFAAYEAGLAQVRADVGGNIDFSSLDHRLKVGVILKRLISGI